MRYIFVSTTCSEKSYKEVFESRKNRMIDPMQKFLLQIMKGLAADCNNKVVSISIKPVSYSCYSKKVVKETQDLEGNVSFIYPKFRNGKISRFITTYIAVYMWTKKIIKENRDAVIITDPLNPHISAAARIAAAKNGNKTIAIITDLPLFASKMKQRTESVFKHVFKNIFESFSNQEAKKYDAYILLTESMNAIVNPNGRPYIVIEGSAVPMVNIDSPKEKDYRVFMYAGGVYEKYGIKSLVEAFILANLENVELHIYGDGTYVETLLDVCKSCRKIKYCGCVLNTELQKIESEADLLINPRFSNEEYTKYSFPSKTLEYLSSGTAVLSTRLKGIPSDYVPYLYWFDEESVEGMARRLQEINALSNTELLEFGLRAQEYVLLNKSNIAQGKKITEFAISIQE